jgi:hypothetical protein
MEKYEGIWCTLKTNQFSRKLEFFVQMQYFSSKKLIFQIYIEF